MPQDADGTGLITLLWAIWIYWSVYWWTEHLSSLKAEDGQHRAPPPPAESTAASPPAAAALASNLATVVSEVLRRAGGGQIGDFLSARLATYEAVVGAFDRGDRETLARLVSAEVYETFADAIDTRPPEQRNMETLFSRIDAPEIVGGRIDGARMEVSVRFIGECFKVCRDSAGKLIGGATSKRQSSDVWTFEAIPAPRGTTWRVTATQADT